MKWRVRCLLPAVFFMAFLFASAAASAHETKEDEKSVNQAEESARSYVEDSLIDKEEMKEIDRVLEEAFPDQKISFWDVITAMTNGEDTISPELLAGFVEDTLFGIVKTCRPAMLYLLLIAIVAAVFANFTNVFKSHQIADIGFYIVYILLITICLKSFQEMVGDVSSRLDMLTTFMKVLGPAYFLSMAVAAGSVTAIAFYNIVLLLIYLVELVILHFLLPLIHVWLMMQILNFLSAEEYLTKMGELLKTVISWSLKTLLTCITGISVVQGILSPAIDSLKRSGLAKGAEMIPGVGDAIGGVTEVILGTAVLIKNGIGMAGVLLAAGICLFPVLNMGVLTLMYKGIAAVIQPVSDKRIVEAINCVGDGCQMLLKVVFTTAVLFLITIAVAAAATS